MQVSVVVCSIDPAKLARAGASYRKRFGPALLEIIAFDDARSLAEAYNRGLDRARGDVVVFSHDDIELLAPEFAARLEAHLVRHDLVGIAGTTRLVGGAWHLAGEPHDAMLVVAPHPQTGTPTMVIEGRGPLVVPGMQALDGVFLATRTTTARALALRRRHVRRLPPLRPRLHVPRPPCRAGLAVCRDLVLWHASQGRYDARWDLDRQRFERKFAGRLGSAPVTRRAPLVNVPIPADVLLDDAELARLTSPATLERFVAKLPPGGAGR